MRTSFRECLDLSDFTGDMRDNLIDCLERFGVRQIPTPGNLSSSIVRCSEVAFVERAVFPLQSMHLEGVVGWCDGAG